MAKAWEFETPYDDQFALMVKGNWKPVLQDCFKDSQLWPTFVQIFHFDQQTLRAKALRKSLGEAENVVKTMNTNILQTDAEKIKKARVEKLKAARQPKKPLQVDMTIE